MRDNMRLSLYVNFLLYAIAGAMGAADTLMRQYGDVIADVAAALLPHKPIGSVCRGMLVDPAHVVAGVLDADTRFTFISYTRNRDVARWFADRNSFISAYFKQFHNPCGFIAERTPAHESVLFCAALQPQLIRVLKDAARRHPLLPGEQIVWNLDTQDEVILKQDGAALRVEPYEAARPSDTAALDARFCPPWIDRSQAEVL